VIIDEFCIEITVSGGHYIEIELIITITLHKGCFTNIAISNHNDFQMLWSWCHSYLFIYLLSYYYYYYPLYL